MRNEKVADAKLSGYEWTGPKFALPQSVIEWNIAMLSLQKTRPN